MFSPCANPRPQPGPTGPALDFSVLTPAERLVAMHVLQGMSNKEIAEALTKAPYTIKVQVGAILRKLNVATRLRFLAGYYQGLLAVQEVGDQKGESDNTGRTQPSPAPPATSKPWGDSADQALLDP